MGSVPVKTREASRERWVNGTQLSIRDAALTAQLAAG